MANTPETIGERADAFAEMTGGLVSISHATRLGVPTEEIMRQLKVNRATATSQDDEPVNSPDTQYAIGNAGDEPVFEK